IRQDKSSSTDHRDNANAKSFREYLQGLCQRCQDKGKTGVVFAMNNTKHHRREEGTVESAKGKRKELFSYNTGKAIKRFFYLKDKEQGLYSDTEEAGEDREKILKEMRTTLEKMQKPGL
ncbi:hypothetical protein BGZ54_002278, partial [Gamsiella multidivaricata]